MPFQIIRDDITRVRADAIVNTANPDPICASGTDHAVYMAAGAEKLLAERRKIGEIKTGEAAATPAFRLHAKFIIHTVGPAWQDGKHGELEELASCYRSSLELAKTLNCGSIAFPLISAGVYGFPKDRALGVALEAISAFLQENEMDVTLVVFNRTAFELSKDRVEGVRQFIDDRYVEERHAEEYGMDYHAEPGLSGDPSNAARREEQRRRQQSFWKRTDDIREQGYASGNTAQEDEDLELNEASDMFLASSVEWNPARPPAQAPQPSAPASAAAAPGASGSGQKLSDIMKRVGETFQQMLLRKIDEKGFSDVEVYKKANIDRKLFSKIRCNPYYSPRRQTAVALAIALKLNLDETVDLLARAGYALSPSSKFDLIVEYCIENRIYDIFEVNAILFEYDQPLLGC